MNSSRLLHAPSDVAYDATVSERIANAMQEAQSYFKQELGVTTDPTWKTQYSGRELVGLGSQASQFVQSSEMFTRPVSSMNR